MSRTFPAPWIPFCALLLAPLTSAGWQGAPGSPGDDGLADGTVVQQAYLKASNTDAGDRFGYALAISGDTVVVGAYREDSASNVVNGNQADNSLSNAGAVYVFVRNGSTWTQQAYLKASNAGAGDEFGRSVSIDGDTIVVGAFQENGGATGVNGDESDNSALNSGAAYVFVRNGTTWSQQAYLKASNTGADDGYGLRVGISGDTVVVGAWREDSSATGVNGDADNEDAQDSGAAYVYRRTGTTWSLEAYLKASNTEAGDNFGFPVEVNGDTIIVGARLEDGGSAGVNGDDSDNSIPDSGAAYVFVRNGTTWTQEAYLKASNPDPDDRLGHSVEVWGDTAVVGAFKEDSAATGANGDQLDNTATDSGAAYVYVRSGTTWTQEAYLKASNTDAFDRFTLRLGLEGDTLAIGAYQEKSAAQGINGDQLDNSAPEAGSAYVFFRDAGVWTQQTYVKGSNTEAGDNFGRPVVVSGSTMAIGAYPEDSAATGVNGDGSDNSALTAGAAYTFLLCPTSVDSSQTVRLGTPPNPAALVPGLTTGPVMGMTWDPIIAHEVFMPDATLDILALGAGAENLSFPPYGTVLCSTVLFSYLAFPQTPFQVAIPADCSIAGVQLCTQGASWNGLIVRLTNAIDITLGTQ